jgi:hypothetical protein
MCYNIPVNKFEEENSMSAFYGSIQGNRGSATRGGSRNSGIKGSCQSYSGSVITYLDYDTNDNLMVTIEVSDHSSSYGSRIFCGTFDEYIAKLQK